MWASARRWCLTDSVHLKREASIPRSRFAPPWRATSSPCPRCPTRRWGPLAIPPRPRASAFSATPHPESLQLRHSCLLFLPMQILPCLFSNLRPAPSPDFEPGPAGRVSADSADSAPSVAAPVSLPGLPRPNPAGFVGRRARPRTPPLCAPLFSFLPPAARRLRRPRRDRVQAARVPGGLASWWPPPAPFKMHSLGWGLWLISDLPGPLGCVWPKQHALVSGIPFSGAAAPRS